MPKTILVVDDDPDIRGSLSDALGGEGYNVCLAAGGEEALALLPSLRKPYGVILDITMPKMSGVEFYRRMRAMPAYADVPVVILTSDPARAPQELPTMKKTISLDLMLETVAGLF